MKKLIYVGLIALLGVNFGCQKEDLTEDNLELENKLNLNSDLQKSGADNYYDENGNPVEVYYLYLDMDLIEANYTGSYTGSFSQHYYNEMSNHFTIHNVEYAGPGRNCGNIERWTVTKEEYEYYLFTIGETLGETDGVIVVESGTDTGEDSTGNTSSNNSDSEGWGDDEGNVNTDPNNKDKPIRTNPDRGDVPLEYVGCF